MFQTSIVRVPHGALNRVSDAQPGGALLGPKAGRAPGQLGQGIWVDERTLQYDPLIGRLYPGHYRYVKLSADIPPIPATIEPPAAAIPVTRIDRGQLVFWDQSVDPTLYQVTLDEGTDSVNVPFLAGICINPNWVPGEYSWIQSAGICAVLFGISVSANIGDGAIPLYNGPGPDQARAGRTDNPAAIDLFGILREAVTSGGHLGLVELVFRNYR